MFGLGLNLGLDDFKQVGQNKCAVSAGVTAQLFFLPLTAWIIGTLFRLPPLFQAGLMLIALCPGGVTSNTFTLLARGDVALSVTLTAISSFISVLTIPLAFALLMPQYLAGSAGQIASATPRIILQILLTTLLPVIAGMTVRNHAPERATLWHNLIKKITPLLLLTSVLLYFLSQRAVILKEARTLLTATMTLAAATMGLGALLARILKLPPAMRRTIVIETGLQNAAQAIAIGSNPALVSDPALAVPAIIYALAMNIACFGYAYAVILRKRN